MEFIWELAVVMIALVFLYTYRRKIYLFYTELKRPEDIVKPRVTKRTTTFDVTKTSNSDDVMFYPTDFLIANGRPPNNVDHKNAKASLEDYDKYIGTFDTGGVLYDKDFPVQPTQVFVKDPASYTTFIDDYLVTVAKPDAKPYPQY